ncbi:hypothetical protein Gotri_001520 [Gossypium trilobum]|uniref:Uncharacterized protein n=1 Tax=Gossypium trilobum TaxID=34281 RepID=A0A7J9FEZ4_9ROSI|nr:hypothetical protein [Gossypium trilobum]
MLLYLYLGNMSRGSLFRQHKVGSVRVCVQMS